MYDNKRMFSMGNLYQKEFFVTNFGVGCMILNMKQIVDISLISQSNTAMIGIDVS